MDIHSHDLDALLDAATEALDSLASPPRRVLFSRACSSSLSPEDEEESDDDMEHEEARLPQSAEKLREVLFPCDSPEDAFLSGSKQTEASSPPPRQRQTPSPLAQLLLSSGLASVMPAMMGEGGQAAATEEDGSSRPSLIWGTPSSSTSTSTRTSPEDGREDKKEDGEGNGIPSSAGAPATPAAGLVDVPLQHDSNKSAAQSSPPVTGTSPDMEDFPSGDRLQESAVHGHYSGLNDLPGGSNSYLCRHLVVCTMRPDVLCGTITEALVDVAQAYGLTVTKRQGSHVMAEMPPKAAGQWEWRIIDMQVGVDRDTRDRVLVIRFIMTLPMPSTGYTAAEAETRRRRPATRRFLYCLRTKLEQAALFKHALKALPGSEAPSLDPQFVAQLDNLAREEMNSSLESTARGLDEYARAAEWRCAQLMSTMQPMFELYKVDMPAPIKPLPLSSYPLDLATAMEAVESQRRRRGDDDGDEDDEEEVEGGDVDDDHRLGSCRQQQEQGEGSGGHGGQESGGGAGSKARGSRTTGLERINGLIRRTWSSFLRQCDAEMTARMQRKNLQVMDRLTKTMQFQRRMLQCLRDSRQVLSCPTFTSFQSQTAKVEGLMHDSEAPLYFCGCLVSTRPAVLHCTYWHLVFISRVPGLRALTWTRAIHFKDIASASLVSSLRLGITLTTSIRLEVRNPAMTSDHTTNSKTASTATTMTPSGKKKRGGKPEDEEHKDEAAAAAAAAPAGDGGGGESTSSSSQHEVVTFTTTTDPGRVLDLLKVLINLHNNKGDADEMQEYYELSSLSSSRQSSSTAGTEVSLTSIDT